MDLVFPTLAPTIPVERMVPILRRHWSVSVPGVPGGKGGPPGCGLRTISLISFRSRFILSVEDVVGSSQLCRNNSNVLETLDLLVLGMKHL